MSERAMPEIEQNMDQNMDKVDYQVKAPAADRFLDRVVERIGGSAATNAVYGAPVERDGVTVIPVAKVRWGFGGGAGRGGGDQGGAHGEGAGEGGGVGMAISPLGYIEIRDGEAQFRRIIDASSLLFLPPVILALGVGLRLVLVALRPGRSRALPMGPRGILHGARLLGLGK